MSHPLSKKQLEVMRAMESFARVRGHIPSVRELAARLRKSPTTVFQHLKALERRGYLKGDGSAHGWTLLKVSEGRAADAEAAGATSGPAQDLQDPAETSAAPGAATATGGRVRAVVAGPRTRLPDPDRVPAGWIRVPIAGTIAAGTPIEAVEDATESRVFPQEMVPDGAFALHVRGDSMIDDHILDGDLIVVRPQDEVLDGEIAVALLDDGSATLKRVFREKGRVRLQPAHPTMEPIYADHVRIQGRVVGIWRNVT